METLKRTVVTEMLLNEDKTERYLYKRVWSRAKNPKLACVLTIRPTSSEPNTMDLTTMLVANEIHEMGLDGFFLVNLTSKITTHRRKMKAEDFSNANDSVILEACLDEGVEKIILAVGSITKTNQEVIEKLKELTGQLPDERKELVEVLVGRNGPIHPLSPEARSIGGWQLAKLAL